MSLQADRRDLLADSAPRRARWGFSVAFFGLVLSGATAYLAVVRLNQNTDDIEHTYQLIDNLDALTAAASEVQIGGRRYITSQHPENLDRYRQGLLGIEEAAPAIRRLVTDQAAQRERFAAVERSVADYLADLSSAIAIARTQGPEAAQRLDPDKGRRLYDELRRGTRDMVDAEKSTLMNLQLGRRRDSLTAKLVIVIVGLLASAVAAIALSAIRRQFAARARAEAELRLAKEDLERRVFERTRDLRGIVESSDDAIITKNLDGVITSWNPGAVRIFGYAPNQAIGRSIQFIIPPERADEEPSILARLARGERVDHFETVRVRSDGTRIDVSATISPLLDGAGRVVGASKIARDITERRAHEHKVRAQLERLNLLEQITRAIRERQDLKSIHHVVTRSLQEDMPVDFACIATYDADNGAVQLSDVVSADVELAHRLASTDGRPLRSGALRELIYEPELAGSGIEYLAVLARCGLRSAVIKPLSVAERVFAALIVARFQPSSFTSADVEFLHQLGEHLALASHQAELHGSLQAAYDDLRQTQQTAMQHERLRALGEMASGVAHDINNALAPPALYLQILLQHEKSLSEEAREYLKIIERSLDDVAGTIARLRLFYAVREPELTVKTVDLNQLVEQIAEITSARWKTMPLEHGLVIKLERRLDASLPRIAGDEGEIRDALRNLVFNAVDAMPQGGTLTLRSSVEMSSETRVEGSRGRVCLEISDTGLGMTDAVRTRCLEPFFTTKGSLGSGLGLAMVYGMAQRHDATLEIDSAPGAGTTIRLLFPPASDMSDAPVLPLEQAPVPRRILIIDDDPLVLKALRDALSSDGHSVVAADGAHRGIEEFARAHGRGESFEAVFTDLGMPNLDGRFVARSIKTLAPEVPVILLTGWGRQLAETDQAFPCIDRVLSKPPKLPELRAALAELIRGAGTSDPRDASPQT